MKRYEEQDAKKSVMFDRKALFILMNSVSLVMSPLQFNGTMNGRLFEFWFENCPLRECPSNSVIVMDNAAFHRKKRLISLAESNKYKAVFPT
ncbi:MAG: transposase [Clostridiales bacterium]|jgi:transposase|nr:transposase [Clostridiales bacterium]